MAHVIVKTKIPGGLLVICECGRVLGFIAGPPFNEEVYEAIGQGHREHARIAFEVEYPWRLGNNPNPAVRAQELNQAQQLPPWYPSKP